MTSSRSRRYRPVLHRYRPLVFTHRRPERRGAREFGQVPHTVIELRGSLAATGIGHGTDRAVLLGLVGYTPTTTTADTAPLPGELIGPHHREDRQYQIKYNPQPVPEHPNCVIFSAWDEHGTALATGREYFSVGGGFILDRAGLDGFEGVGTEEDSSITVPFPFRTAQELLSLIDEHSLTISQLVRANEETLHDREVSMPTSTPCGTSCRVRARLKTEHLPGGLNVKLRTVYRMPRRKQSGDVPRPRCDALGQPLRARREPENAALGQVVLLKRMALPA